MGTETCTGRIDAPAVAPGMRKVWRDAMRARVSIFGVTVVAVMATAVLLAVSTVSPAVRLSADSTALVLCGTTCPTPDAHWVESVKNQFIEPTHPGQDIDYVAVTAPMELWPVTGLFRVLGLALGPPSLWGPGGPGWPDEPWWKISGLFDLSGDKSLQAGVADLEAAMAANGNDHLVIYGNSQGAGIANVVKRKLAEQYPAGTTPPSVDFVLGGDPNLPNGGLMSRFAGLHIPILDLTFNGPATTDTPFKTVEINRQYDGFSDFPLYPLNLVADLNAVLGTVYVHMYGLDVSLAPDATTSPTFQGTHGDTSYYFFPTADLPLFGPLRTLGVPEPLIDVVEPFFKVLVEAGYDRSIPPWKPTAARLIPTLDPGKVATDLVDAVGEGVDNAARLFGVASVPHDSSPAKVTPSTQSLRTQSPSNDKKATVESTPSKQPEGTSGPASNQQTNTDQSTAVIESTSSAPVGADESTPSKQRMAIAGPASHQQTNGTRNSTRSGRGDATAAHDDGADPAGSTDTAKRPPAHSASVGGTSAGGSSEDDGDEAAKQ